MSGPIGTLTVCQKQSVTNLKRAEGGEISAVVGLDKWTLEGAMNRIALLATKCPVSRNVYSRYRAGMCWHSDEMGTTICFAYRVNQGGTADFTSVLVFKDGRFLIFQNTSSSQQ